MNSLYSWRARSLRVRSIRKNDETVFAKRFGRLGRSQKLRELARSLPLGSMFQKDEWVANGVSQRRIDLDRDIDFPTDGRIRLVHDSCLGGPGLDERQRLP